MWGIRLLRAVGLQAVPALVAWYFFAPLGQPLQWSLLHGVLRGLLGWQVGERGVLWVLQILLLPLLVSLVWMQLPSWVNLLAALGLFAVSRNALIDRVPLYLSSEESVERLAQWLPKGVRVLDLGSGTGTFVLQLANKRPDITVVGVENAVLPWLWGVCRYRLGGQPGNVELRYGNFWKVDWAAFDAIHAFLSPAPMQRVWAQFVQSASPDAVLISNTFDIDGQVPAECLPLSGPLQKELLIWRQPHGTS